MRLAVHDLIPLNIGENAIEAYEKTGEFVKVCEELGYTRYWFSEHHGIESLASIAPELMIAYYAGQTEKIRLGSGGTMIMHYSPYKIAEDFKTLTAMAPDRIDLGLGRAPGCSPKETNALAQGDVKFQGHLYDKMDIILKLLTNDRIEDSTYRTVTAYPDFVDKLPEPWMLGSTGASVSQAAQFGLGYSFVKWFGRYTSPQVFETYRDRFQPSPFFDQAQISISYKVLITETQDELDYLSKSFELSHLAGVTHHEYRLQDPEDVKDYEYSQREENYLHDSYENRYLIKGTKDQVQKILEEEIDIYNMDELMFYLPIYDKEARKKAYKLLAEIFL